MSRWRRAAGSRRGLGRSLVLVAALVSCLPAPRQSPTQRCLHPQPTLAGVLSGRGSRTLALFAGGLVGAGLGDVSWLFTVYHYGADKPRELTPEGWPVARLCFAADEEHVYWVYSKNEAPRRCLLLTEDRLYWIDDRNGVVYRMSKDGGQPVALGWGAPTELATDGRQLYWGTNRSGAQWQHWQDSAKRYVRKTPMNPALVGTVLRITHDGSKTEVLAQPPAHVPGGAVVIDPPFAAIRGLTLPDGEPETVWHPSRDVLIGSVALDQRFVYASTSQSVMRIARATGDAEVLSAVPQGRSVTSLLAYDQVVYWSEVVADRHVSEALRDDQSRVLGYTALEPGPSVLLRGDPIYQLLASDCDLFAVSLYSSAVRIPTLAARRPSP